MNKRETCQQRKCLYAVYIGEPRTVSVGNWSGHLETGATFCVPPSEIDNPLFDVDAPGTRLKLIFASYGAKPCERCKATAAKMDRHGAEWCRENADDLIAEIKSNIYKLSWWEQAKAAKTAIRHGLTIKGCFWEAVKTV